MTPAWVPKTWLGLELALRVTPRTLWESRFPTPVLELPLDSSRALLSSRRPQWVRPPTLEMTQERLLVTPLAIPY